MDDILIASATQDDHVKRMREVFQALVEAGLKLKAAKCNLFSTHIRYLGKLIDKKGVQPDPEKLEAVEKWETPKDLRQVASFLGFAGYYREFVKD